MSNLTGQQLGNYRLVKHLGTGGFGEVYLGTHIHLQRESAIKILLRLDEQEIERFRNEAQIIGRLIHPHIITLFDYDVVGEVPFIVMMYAQHGTMRERYRPGTRVPLAEVVKYITQAANGLQFAHDQHVVHRDIKPANMLLGSSEQLLLSDFGLAVMWSGTHSIHTQKVIGTHGYMAPEQFQGRTHPASDQYSLAITAYEWLSGSRPMADALLGLGMLQVAWPETEIPALRRVAPHLPAKLDDVLQRALSSNWQERFPSIREFAAELARAANSSGPMTYSVRSATSAETISPLVSSPQALVQPGGWPADTYVSPEVLPLTLPNTPPADAGAYAPQNAALLKTLPAQYGSGSSNPTAPPPPPASYPIYPDYAPPPPAPLQRTSTKAFRPLALPVTRAKHARASWAWTLGYTAFLLFLGAEPVALAATYRAASTPPTWIIVLTVIDIILLVMLSTVLCGALLGKWRAPLVTIFSIGLTVLCVYLVNPGAFASSGNTQSSSNGIDYLLYGVLPLSAFVVGWIYERRRYANFGLSFLTMIVGIALLIILPILVAPSLSSPGSYTDSAIAASLITVWCLVVLIIFPLALIAAGLEVLMHKMVKVKESAAKKEGE
ncbi:MAG TPA: serine/threonine-protein kinase [Ktedonobacteraceae bacterium]|nr:serine/threonine-protein kinase [Ktedonobacteraceae bacterium]